MEVSTVRPLKACNFSALIHSLVRIGHPCPCTSQGKDSQPGCIKTLRSSLAQNGYESILIRDKAFGGHQDVRIHVHQSLFRWFQVIHGASAPGTHFGPLGALPPKARRDSPPAGGSLCFFIGDLSAIVAAQKHGIPKMAPW